MSGSALEAPRTAALARMSSRTPKALPAMRLNPEVRDLFQFHYEDFDLVGYDPDAHIPAPVAV